MTPVYVVIAVPPSLVSVAVLVAAIRAKKDDLPDIVRAIMRIWPKDNGEDDPPSLPKP